MPRLHIRLLFPVAIATVSAFAQQVAGFKNEYLDDFAPTSRQLVQLAEAVPADKYGWRPGEGVRSTGEVYLHIATGNYLLLFLTGVKLPAEYYAESPANTGREAALGVFRQNLKLEKSITKKDDVVRILKSSLDAVKSRFSELTAADLDKPVDFFGEKTTARRVYLRILAHNSEHMGQSVAYARMNGIVPPWSRPQSGAQ